MGKVQRLSVCTRTEELAPISRSVITVHLRDHLLEENYRRPLNTSLLSLPLSAAIHIHTAPHVLPPPPLHTPHTQHTTPTITAKLIEGETKSILLQERETNSQLGWGIQHLLATTLIVIVKRRGKEREKDPRGNARENREKENGKGKEKEKEREKRNRTLTLMHIDKAPPPPCLVTTLLLTPLRSSRPGLIRSLSNNNNNNRPFPLPVPQPSTQYSSNFRLNSSYRLSSSLLSSNRVKSHQLNYREMERWKST